MSFANQNARWVYQPNGVTTAFTYDNKVLAAADLAVSWIAADGSTLELPSWSVAGVGNDGGGTVVFSTAPASAAGSRIVIERRTAAVQEGAFLDFLQENAATRQQRFERCMALAQEFKQAMRRMLLYSPLDPDGALVLPPAPIRAGHALLFDALGRPTVGAPMAPGTVVVGGFVEGLLGSTDAAAFLGALGFSAYMQGLKGSANAAALLTGEGWSAYMQGLKGSANAAALKAALEIPTTWTVGSDIGGAGGVLDLASGVVGDERGLTSSSPPIATITGSQRFVRLLSKTNGNRLTHDPAKIASRTGSDIMLRNGDAVTLARTGTDAWREVAFDPAPQWKSANLSGIAAAATLNAVPHYLGKRIGSIRMFGRCTANDLNFTPSMFAADGARLEFPRAVNLQYGWDAIVDDSNVTVSIGTDGLGVVRSPGGGNAAAITPAKWDVWLEIDPR